MHPPQTLSLPIRCAQAMMKHSVFPSQSLITCTVQLVSHPGAVTGPQAVAILTNPSIKTTAIMTTKAAVRQDREAFKKVLICAPYDSVTILCGYLTSSKKIGLVNGETFH